MFAVPIFHEFPSCFLSPLALSITFSLVQQGGSSSTLRAISIPSLHTYNHLFFTFQRSAWPRGRVLGGSASINYNIHMLGSPLDFAMWEEEYGATGWGFDEVLKFANKAECRRLRPKIFKVGKVVDVCKRNPMFSVQ